jgi:hypothetical protein
MVGAPLAQLSLPAEHNRLPLAGEEVRPLMTGFTLGLLVS